VTGSRIDDEDDDDDEKMKRDRRFRESCSLRTPEPGTCNL